jgi:hypothetical protein
MDESPKLWGKPETDELVIESNEHTAEVYAALLKETPKQKFYPFTKHEDIKTSLKTLPPWPCRACGSTRHWYNKCKDRKQYKRISKKQGYAVEQNPHYNAIYDYVSEQYANAAISLAYEEAEVKLDEKFPPFNQGTNKNNFWLHVRYNLRESNLARGQRTAFCASIKDCDEPKPEWVAHVEKPKAVCFLSCPIDNDETDNWEPPRTILLSGVDPPGGESQPLEDTWDSLSLLDEEEEVKHAHLASVQTLAQGRSYAPGCSTAGVSVLSTQG